MGGVLLMAIQPQIMAIQPQPLPVVLKPQMHTNKKNEVCQKSVIDIILLMEGLQFRCLKSRSCELRSASAWSACQHLCVQNECHPLWTALLKRFAVPNNAKALNCGWRTCDQAHVRETRSCSLDREGRSTMQKHVRLAKSLHYKTGDRMVVSSLLHRLLLHLLTANVHVSQMPFNTTCSVRGKRGAPHPMGSVFQIAAPSTEI